MIWTIYHQVGTSKIQAEHQVNNPTNQPWRFKSSVSSNNYKKMMVWKVKLVNLTINSTLRIKILLRLIWLIWRERIKVKKVSNISFEKWSGIASRDDSCKVSRVLDAMPGIKP